MRESDQAYGRIEAFLHIAGYTIAKAFADVEYLLDEKNRWKEFGFDDVKEFLASFNFKEIEATLETRKRLAKRIKELQPTASNRQIARTVGITHTTIGRGASAPAGKEKTQTKQTPSGASAPKPTLSGTQAASLVQRREERKARDAAAPEREQAVQGSGTIDHRWGDFRGVLSDLHDVDAIITDPPYGKEHLPLLRDLAAFADRVLKPQGILVILFGQTFLPEAYCLLAGFRPYRWTACYLTEGAGYVSHPRAVQSNWKPLLVYGGIEPRFSDLFKSATDGDGKEHHKWGQNFDAFHMIIERLTKPEAIIVDPFFGGGTTLLAAKSLGRNSIGCEIDKETFSKFEKVIHASK